MPRAQTYEIMAYIVMAYIVIAYLVMAYVVHLQLCSTEMVRLGRLQCVRLAPPQQAAGAECA